ncbi:hypothetical protein [Paraburkholderia aromaticivorans]|uniref:DUF4148 domain-containing protein n=1 Tax=Paraburkholderia aromaticivorans TaxID=2026199 RepID=A0A248VH75_9BURK|nr:hypothetical protein [Paraburkholderia aromaticivorans]ASV98387.1 hypothetical protein CJU94_09490 [Paraburkholderia aromaticivorans]
MRSKLLAALLVATVSSIAAPAFASGYGPAPSYRASVGAPASQRGQSAQTVATERNEALGLVNDSYGGVVAQSFASGSRQPDASVGDVYLRH